MELADLILINKADDDLQALAGRSAADYRSALRLLHPRSVDWKVEVQTCSARDGLGIAEAWEVALQHREVLEASGQFSARRAAQARDWMWSEVNDSLIAALQGDPEVRKQIPALESRPARAGFRRPSRQGSCWISFSNAINSGTHPNRQTF